MYSGTPKVKPHRTKFRKNGKLGQDEIKEKKKHKDKASLRAIKQENHYG